MEAAKNERKFFNISSLSRLDIYPAWLQRVHVDVFAVAALAFITVLSRLPYWPSIFTSFDAINYALALDHFDMRLAQPQAPGYPLYILVGRIFYRLVDDPLAALVALSVIFSGLAVGVLWMIGNDLFGRQSAYAAVLFLATSTVFWYLGEVAAPYTADLFASAVVGCLAYRSQDPTRRWAPWLAGLALGLAGALRLQTFFFLFPLLLYVLWVRVQIERSEWKLAAGVITLAGLVIAVFFIPAVLISGGPLAFLRSMQGILPIFRSTDTLVRSAHWVRFFYNLRTLGSYSLRILGEAGLLLAAVGFFVWSPGWRFWRRKNLTFLLAWLLPAWFFFFLIWPGNLGTVLVSMPPLFLLAGAGFTWLATGPAWRRVGSIILLVLVIAWNISVFTLLPVRPFGNAYRSYENRAALQRQVSRYQARLSLVRAFPADSTLVFGDDFRHLQYYLPEYQSFSMPRFSKEDPRQVSLVVSIQSGQVDAWKNITAENMLPEDARYLVFIDRPQDLDVSSDLALQELSAGRESIWFFRIPQGEKVDWTAHGIRLE